MSEMQWLWEMHIATNLKTIKNIATIDGQNPYAYSLRPSVPAKTYIISGLGALGVTGVILGVQQINDAKDLHDYYQGNRDAISSKYPYEGLSRPDLYKKANDKYEAGQAFIIGGGIALGAAAWLLIKERIIKPRDKSLSKLSIAPQVYRAEGYNSMGAKGFHVVYTF